MLRVALRLDAPGEPTRLLVLDAGADVGALRAALDAVVPGAVRLDTEEVTRGGQRATKARVRVLVDDPPHRTWASIRAMLAEADLAAIDGRIARIRNQLAALLGNESEIVDRFIALVREQDATIEPLTFESAEGREVYRHSSTHIMAQAVKEVFPTAQLTIGPALDDGFYYDFAFDRPFTPEDLEKIEARAIEIMKRGLTHDTTKKLMLFTLFWHFLDVIWICIFTFVYAFGVLS